MISMSVAAITRKSPATAMSMLLHQSQVAQVLIRDARDRNVVDADLLLPNQVEQEVERPGELAEDELQLFAARRLEQISGCAPATLIGAVPAAARRDRLPPAVGIVRRLVPCGCSARSPISC